MTIDRRKVWGLTEAYNNLVIGEWEKETYATIPAPQATSPAAADYIYSFFSTSNYEKFDMSNDLAQSPSKAIFLGASPRMSALDYVTATSNQDYAFFTGLTYGVSGDTSWIGRDVLKVDYSSETISSFANLYTHRVRALGVGNRHYGWLIGGHSRDTGSAVHSDLDTTSPPYQYYYTFTPDRGSHNDRESIDRIEYSSGTVTLEPRSNWIASTSFYAWVVKRDATCSSCNNDYAWIVRKDYPASGAYTYKFNYSNQTWSSPSYTPSSYFSKQVHFQGGGNNDYMWITGGLYPGDAREVHRLDYSNDTTQVSLRNSLPLSQAGHGFSGNQNNGYTSYGISPSNRGNIRQKLDYSNDTASINYKDSWAIEVDDRIYGMFGGESPASTTFDNSAITNSSYRSRHSDLAKTTAYTTSVSGSQWGLPTSHPKASYPSPPSPTPASYFYFAGGISAPGTSTTVGSSHPYGNSILRFSYANDSETPDIRGYTNSTSYAAYSRIFHASTNNSNYAWLNRGNTSGSSVPTNEVGEPIQRLDFSNDSSVSTRNSSFNNHDHAASGNANYGWWFGGRGEDSNIPGTYNQFPSNRIYRTTYSNDTATPTLRAYQDINASRSGATTNGTYAWLYGGRGALGAYAGYTNYSDGPTGYSDWEDNIQRYTFSSDTTNAVTRAYMHVAPRYALSTGGTKGSGYNPGIKAVGNNSKGYYFFWSTDDWAQTSPVTVWPSTPSRTRIVSDVGEYDYSNDTSDGVSRFPASWYNVRGTPDNFGFDATGNESYGYFGTANGSTMGRIDYSSNTLKTDLRNGGFNIYGQPSRIETSNYPANPAATLSGVHKYIGYTAFSGARNQ